MIVAAFVPTAICYSLIGFLLGMLIGVSLGYIWWGEDGE